MGGPPPAGPTRLAGKERSPAMPATDRRRTRAPRGAAGLALALLAVALPSPGRAQVPTGTEALLVDLTPFEDWSGFPDLRVHESPLLQVGEMLLFVGSNWTLGTELWRTDATEAGTALVKDIRVGALGSEPEPLATVDDTLFFAADDGVHGVELWRSDGSAEGTALVADLTPAGDTLFGQAVAHDGALYFTAGGAGDQLWRSDGTAEGTVLVETFEGDEIESLTAAGGAILFVVRHHELWRSDGTTAGTLQVASASLGSIGYGAENLTAVGEALFFTAWDEAHGWELWRSDGTGPGTTLVKDIRPGPASSDPEQLTAVGGGLYFVADDGVSGAEPWVSLGSAATTTRLEDVEPGAAGSDPAYLVAVDDRLFFAATTSAHGTELWANVASWPPGAALVADLRPGPESSDATPLVGAAGSLYLEADHYDEYGSQIGYDIWRSDGTAEGTERVVEALWGSAASTGVAALGDALVVTRRDGLWTTEPSVPGLGFLPAPAAVWSLPNPVLRWEDEAYFGSRIDCPIYEGTACAGLLATDGTAAGTRVVRLGDEYGWELRQAASLTRLGDLLLFTMGDGTHGRELWRSDGTPEGTALVKDLYPGSGSAFSGLEPEPLVVSGSHVFFTRGARLWKSDGTEAGTVLVEDLGPWAEGSTPTDLVDVDGTLYFTLRDGAALWRSDGTPEGTGLVRDFDSYYGWGGAIYPASFQARLYFLATEDGYNEGLWRTDATGSGAERLKYVELPDGLNVSEPLRPTVIGDTLYFVAGSSGYGVELWRSDGTEAGTEIVADLRPGPESSTPAFLTDVDGTLFFTADDGTNGREPWTSDGTAAGTLRLDVRPGPLGSVELESPLPPDVDAGRFAAAGGLLAFRANDGVRGEELWVSDGTPQGTRIATDVAVPGGSLPAGITAVGDVVLFAAFEPSVGRELFALPLASLVDTDGDGLDDHAESEEHATDPNLADTDGDGLDDGDEVLVYGTDPLDPDTDGDGSPDGHEVNTLGTDPLDPTEGGTAVVPALHGTGALVVAAVLAGIGALRLRRRG